MIFTSFVWIWDNYRYFCLFASVW